MTFDLTFNTQTLTSLVSMQFSQEMNRRKYLMGRLQRNQLVCFYYTKFCYNKL